MILQSLYVLASLLYLSTNAGVTDTINRIMAVEKSCDDPDADCSKDGSFFKYLDDLKNVVGDKLPSDMWRGGKDDCINEFNSSFGDNPSCEELTHQDKMRLAQDWMNCNRRLAKRKQIVDSPSEMSDLIYNEFNQHLMLVDTMCFRMMQVRMWQMDILFKDGLIVFSNGLHASIEFMSGMGDYIYPAYLGAGEQEYQNDTYSGMSLHIGLLVCGFPLFLAYAWKGTGGYLQGIKWVNGIFFTCILFDIIGRPFNYHLGGIDLASFGYQFGMGFQIYVVFAYVSIILGFYWRMQKTKVEREINLKKEQEEKVMEEKLNDLTELLAKLSLGEHEYRSPRAIRRKRKLRYRRAKRTSTMEDHVLKDELFSEDEDSIEHSPFQHIRHVNEEPEVKTMKFKPGDIGISYDGRTITNVKKGSQAEEMEVQRGWKIVKVCALEVTDSDVDERLTSAKNKKKAFAVAFDTSTPDVYMEPDSGSGSGSNTPRASPQKQPEEPSPAKSDRGEELAGIANPPGLWVSLTFLVMGVAVFLIGITRPEHIHNRFKGKYGIQEEL